RSSLCTPSAAAWQDRPRSLAWPRLRVFALVPSMKQVVGHAKLVTDPADDEVDRVLKRPGPSVEGGHGRQDRRAGLRASRQVTELDQAQRRLAWDKHEAPPLF